ncbi:late competence development ComFB family protein [Niameybacter massiliensis]|uniref:Late competence development ComFB family protein n=1 Tax=Holtiella tumoricola TaxID=3018743 RepID=A0AA42J1S7_9FIRM|nr:MULTISPECIES: late competence development ComFB family protein [Lachnospirales]MDA3732481.1 late competence development ComFB family protein [Holtiella tumoricola]
MEGIKNYTEDIVELILNSVLDEYKDICKCDYCKRDIAAIALNSLPTYYGSTKKGEVIAKSHLLSSQMEIDVIAAITKGVEKVSRDVRHDK